MFHLYIYSPFLFLCLYLCVYIHRWSQLSLNRRIAGRKGRSHLNLLELTWRPLNSLELTRTHLNSVEPPRSNSVELTSTHLNSFELTWADLTSLTPTCTDLNSLELTWTHLNSPETCVALWMCIAERSLTLSLSLYIRIYTYIHS